MKLLTCMSISGSIPVVICLLMYLIQRADYNYTLGRRLLITGIFFYLMPVQLIKYLIPKDVFPTSMLITDESQLYLSGSLSFTPERQGEYIWMPQWFDIISKIWLVAIIIFAIYQIISFWRGAHSIQNYIFDKVEDSDNNQVYYLIPDGICGPCTIGFFRQKIVFPESFPMLHSEYDMVYKHEHSHLKNHDNLVKVLCLLVLCLHWMNPVAYLLLFLYIDTAEIVSDSAAVEGCLKECRKDYATLLVNEASTPDKNPVMWKNNLFSNKKKSGKNMKILKRRIDYMMKEKKKGLLQRGIMVAVSALTIVSGAGTVLAYEPMLSSDESFSDVISDESLDVFAYNSSEFDPLAFLDFSKSNSIFIDNNGIQLACDESLSPYALCTHSMIDGTFYTHSKNSSGGCTVKVYTCKRCEKCGYLANKKYSHSITSTKCTHNF
jgi:beta-lactamase regulating signal transducer with metallopeptidase domain